MKTLSAERLNELTKQIGEWAAANFKVHEPTIGILEEIGELSHAILKRMQGIRGFDKPEFFAEKFGDALADIGVYSLHAMYLAEGEFDIDILEPLRYENNTPETKLALAKLADLSATLLNEPGNAVFYVADLLQWCMGLASANNMDFEALLESTWEKVSKRDWRKNPTNADKAEETKENLPVDSK